MKRLLIGLVIGLVIGSMLAPSRAAAVVDVVTITPTRLASSVTNTPEPLVTETEIPQLSTPIVTNTPTAAPTLESYPGIKISDPVSVTKNITLGLTGQVQCWNCAPFEPSFQGEPVQVKLSNYTPWAGGPNCWDWSEDFKYCMSETRSGLSWEEFYGFSAACPEEWPHGTWVNVDEVGAFVCLDTGNEVVCHEGKAEEIERGEPAHCHVDLLGPSGSWNQSLKSATLWVSLNPRR